MRFGAAALIAAAALLAAAAGRASAAAAAPSATTGPVSQIGSNSATATGTVNPGGQTTTWYFEYGTSTSYGSKSATSSAGNGTAGVDVSAVLGNLSPGTTYHYRLVASNDTGTDRGGDGIFTTTAAPSAVTGSASDLASNAATLNGTVDPNGRSTSWYFEYGTSTSYGSQSPTKSAGSGTSAGSVSARVSGLSAGQTYHYRLVATSDAGTSRGSDRTFSLGAAPAVSTAAASSVSTTSARLNGSVVPNGASTSWYFEYGTTTSYGSKTSSSNAGSGTRPVSVSRSVSRLTPGIAYHFRLVATSAAGTAYGSDQSFLTVGPPAARTGSAQVLEPTKATVTGSVDPRGRSTTWYFEYGTTTSYGSRTPSQSAGSRSGDVNVSATLSSLAGGATYHYRLVATSDAGTTRGSDATFTSTGITLARAAVLVSYGRPLMLSGTVLTRQAGETVTILAQRLGETSFRSVATVRTDAAGVWRYAARPEIRTAYMASWKGATTGQAIVGVRPMVRFRVLSGGRFSVRVQGARSFMHRVVQLQRRKANGGWVTVKRVRLGTGSAAVFRARLPRGRSTLRVAMSVNQAGAGYLAGISRTRTYRAR